MATVGWARLDLSRIFPVVTTLAQLLRKRRNSLIERWLGKVRATLPTEQKLDEQELLDSLHHFLDEVIGTLEKGDGALPELGVSIAQAHGAQRQVLQREIAEVVREYGLFFESVIDECPEPLPPQEYARLVTALNHGAAEAVREFSALRSLDLRRQAWEHFAFLAHEIRGPLQSARMASALVRSAASPERGLQVLDRSLTQMAEAIEGALIDARLRGIDAGAALRLEQVELGPLLRHALEDARADAEARHIRSRLEAPAGASLFADRRVLLAAVSNLLRNAVKFTHSQGEVVVRAAGQRIEVEDQCGGLAPGQEEQIFESFRQASEDRTGFGLGLAIAKRAVEAHRGKLSVRNLPGKGCIFSIELPEKTA